MSDELTPERIHAELLGGPGRWLFTVLCLPALVLVVWVPFDPEAEVAFPVHLRQRGIIVSSAIALVVFLVFAVVNWRNHVVQQGRIESGAEDGAARARSRDQTMGPGGSTT